MPDGLLSIRLTVRWVLPVFVGPGPGPGPGPGTAMMREGRGK